VALEPEWNVGLVSPFGYSRCPFHPRPRPKQTTNKTKQIKSNQNKSKQNKTLKKKKKKQKKKNKKKHKTKHKTKQNKTKQNKTKAAPWGRSQITVHRFSASKVGSWQPKHWSSWQPKHWSS
jgi:hypothetical protein